MGNRKLYRSRDQVVGGVCGGLANYLGIDKSIVRIIVFLAVFLGGVSFWLYILAWVIIPVEPKDAHIVIIKDDEGVRDQTVVKDYMRQRDSASEKDNGPEW